MKNLADFRKMVEKGLDLRPSSPIYIFMVSCMVFTSVNGHQMEVTPLPPG